MKFYEKIDYQLRQYRYRRKRNQGKAGTDLDIERFLDEVDECVGEIMDQVERFLSEK